MKKILLAILVLLPLASFAQENKPKTPSVKISGLVKGKWEYCLEDNTNRFDLRNSRLGVSGNLNSIVDYKVQVEYSNHGSLNLLDAFATLNLFENFKVSIGQLDIPFSEDYVVSPTQNIFANRTFVAKFTNPSTRDLGAYATYKLKSVPLTFYAGLYNGYGINNPKWQDAPFVLGRVNYGTMDGFRTSVKYYGGKDSKDNKLAQYGLDMRYGTSKYAIEAEFVMKDSIDKDVIISGTYLQGYYHIPINNCKTIKYIRPTLRADAMGYNILDRGFDIGRATIGINLGLDTKALAAEIRLNYEGFIFHSGEDELRIDGYYANFFDASDKRIFDKFTIELLVKF